MASALSLALRAIQPRDRAHECVEGVCNHQPVSASLRRRPKSVKHSRSGPFRDRTGAAVLWHTTKRYPWDLRVERRKRNRAQRQARRVNR